MQRKTTHLIAAGVLLAGLLVLAAAWRPMTLDLPLRLALSVGLLLVVAVTPWIRRRAPRAGPLLCWVLLGILLVSLYAENRRNAVRFVRGQYIQAWNAYHYYMGSKYFDRLGYQDLYKATLWADRRFDLGLGFVSRTTDLESYVTMSRDWALEDRTRLRALFDDEGWQEFAEDTRVFVRHAGPGQFGLMLRDHGYNASPFNNTVFALFSKNFSIRDRAARTLPLALDTVFLLAAGLLLWWSFGAHRALLVMNFFALFFGVQHFQLGGFLRFDWFLATVAAVCLWNKRLPRMAGLCLAYAAMARIFPAFLLAGPVLQLVRVRLRERRWDSAVLWLAGAFAVGCLVAFLIGALNARGFGAWADFWHNIRHHSANHYLGSMRVGLQKVFAFDLTVFEMPRTPNGLTRAYESLRWLHLTTVAVWSVAWLAGLWRRRGTDALVLGLGLAFLLSVLSRYYWALWGLFLLTDARPGGRDGDHRLHVLSLAFTPVFCVAAMWTEEKMLQFQIATWFMAVFFLAFTIVNLLRREPAAEGAVKGSFDHSAVDPGN